jgi:hypothetical protein
MKEYSINSEGYIKSDIVAEKLMVRTATINKWCADGLIEGAKKNKVIGSPPSWHLPGTIVDEFVEISKHYVTQKDLESLLGVSYSAIKRLIDLGDIKLEKKTNPFEKWYIDKRSPIVQDLLKQKQVIEKGEFLSKQQASKHFGLTPRMIDTMRRNDLEHGDEFNFLDGNVYVKKQAVENIITERRIDINFTPLKEVAEILKRDNNRLRINCRKGEIPGAYVERGEWLIPNNYLEEALKKQEMVNQYMDIIAFANETGQTHVAIYKKIRNGRIPEFILIDDHWYIPVEAVSYYKEHYDWLKPKEWSLKNASHYSKDTVIKDLMERLSKIEKKELESFNELFKNYSINYINGSRSKGDSIRAYANDFFNIYDKIITLFPNDLSEDVGDNFKEVLSTSGVSTRLIRLFNTFLRYATAQKDIVLDQKLNFSHSAKDKEVDKEIYTPEIYHAFNLYARKIDNHILMACKSAYYANMWVYVLLHLTDVWRKADYVQKIPSVNLDRFGINKLIWFKENRLSSEQCQQIVNEMHQKLGPEVTNKTGSYLTFLVEPTLIECVAHGVAISEIHRKISGREHLLYSFLPKNGSRTNVSKRHYRFFDDEPELKIFRNQIMSRSTLTYFHYNLIDEGNDTGDIAIAFLPAVLRSHEYDSTTSIYIGYMNKDSSINTVASNLFKRGHFGWLYNYMIIVALDETKKVQSLEERTNTIMGMRQELSPLELEEWSLFLKVQYTKKQNVINQLSKMTKEELIALIRKIFMQEMPSKTKPGQCIAYPNCVYPEKDNCFGCEYFIPQYYVLIEAAKEFKRLVKSMRKARYETTFMRDKQLLLTTFTIISEAKAIYPSELIEGFLPLSERKAGIEMIQTKEFVGG